jgi:hypothetical protein
MLLDVALNVTKCLSSSQTTKDHIMVCRLESILGLKDPINTPAIA